MHITGYDKENAIDMLRMKIHPDSDGLITLSGE
jgi:hypothetical protein